MEKSGIPETKTNNEISQSTENHFSELVNNRNSKLNERTQVVAEALRKKLETDSQTPGKSNIEIQVEKSELYLEELKRFGNELVNNIKAANEKQELLRGQYKHGKDIELQEKLRKEADLSLMQFDDISKKWEEMNNLKEPMAIYEDMQKQRENIANLMSSKDELIEQCQQELINITNKYYEDIDKQSTDICILVERVDHQVKLLKKSYRISINELQSTIETEKQKILQVAQEKWGTIFEHLKISEDKKIALVKDKQNFYAQEVDNIRSKQEEISRTTKIRLEKDAEILELEIRKTQANILMNSEKIDYNYQVLQKKNEENIIISNQQKRRVAKLNESIVALKKKLSEIRESNTGSMEKLSVDVQKLHGSINDMQAKAEYFRKNNMIKFTKVWKINFDEIKHLVTRLLQIDRILYEQQLGRKWMKPCFDLYKLGYTNDCQDDDRTNKVAKETFKPLVSSAYQNQLRDILHKISDRAGFLVEEKLLEILNPYTDKDKCLVKIESIFSALHITNIAMVESLIKYFEPYTWCPKCSSGPIVSSLMSLCHSNSQSNGVESIPDDKKNYQNKTKASSSDVVCESHTPSVEPTLVLAALKEFITKEINTPDRSAETRKNNKKFEVDLLNLDENHITSYWQQFSSYMSKEQQNLWKSVEHGLNHYLEVLKKRAEIDSQCVFLQKQNAELKYLLQKL